MKKIIFILLIFFLGCASTTWIATERATMTFEETQDHCLYESNKATLEGGGFGSPMLQYTFIESCFRKNGFIEQHDS